LLEVCFGIFFKIETVYKNIIALNEPEGYLFIQQNFPPLETDFVGKDVIPNSQKLLEFFKKSYTELIINYLEDNKQSQSNDNWVYMLGVKKREK